MQPSFGKAEIVNRLVRVHGYRSYLELCTGTTGFAYGRVDRTPLERCHRLMYACPAAFDDGLPIDFRAAGFDIGSCLQEIVRRRLGYDVMLVDPHYEYETSRRDLEAAFALIGARGSLVVHDCLPPDAKMAEPGFRPGAWCGVTYKAYLDFVLGRDDLAYYTVDVDFGCGVIRKARAKLGGTAPSPPRPGLIEEWRQLGMEFAATYRFFARHQRELLKLVTVEEFMRMEQGGALR